MIAVTGTGPEFSYVDKLRAADRGEEDLDLFLGLQVDGAQGDFDTARATGGRYEIVLSAMGADDALRKLDAHLRAGYRIVYATVPDLKKRKLELSVARPGTKVFLPLGSEREPSKAEP